MFCGILGMIIILDFVEVGRSAFEDFGPIRGRGVRGTIEAGRLCCQTTGRDFACGFILGPRATPPGHQDPSCHRPQPPPPLPPQ